MSQAVEVVEGTAEAVRLATLDQDARRDRGVVYTPDYLAGFVLDQVFGAGCGPTGPTLDPACGTGVFIRALIRRIAAGLDDEPAERRRTSLTSLMERLVWGIDTDEVAVRLARRHAAMLVQELAPGPPLPSDFLKENIRVGDFLTGAGSLPKTRFACIVGNPPYVAINRISESERAQFRMSFTTAFGRMDLYTLFMEQATSRIAPGGRFAFITPDKFLSSVSAGPLRTLLQSRGSMISVTTFDSHRIFAGAATVPCVSVWEALATPTPILRSSATVVAQSKQTIRVASQAAISTERFVAGRRVDRARGFEPLLERLTAGHRSVRSVTRRVSAGLATGLNPAFVLNEATAGTIEPELVHRSVRGRDIRAHHIDCRNEFLLVPYTWDRDGRGRLIDLRRFPAADAWLSQHRAALENRHCVRRWGKAWWDLHDPVGLPLHLVEKVLVPDLARTNRFAVDSSGLVPLHSAYYLLPDGISTLALATFLNSSAVELLIGASAPIAKDGFRRYRRQFLVDLPVPSVDARMDVQLRAAVRDAEYATADELVSKAFGVDHDEVLAALASRLDCQR